MSKQLHTQENNSNANFTNEPESKIVLPDDSWLPKLLFNFSRKTHLIKVENRIGRLTDNEAIAKYQEQYTAAQAAIQAHLLAAEQVAKQERITKNRSFCGCPMCTFHSEAYELEQRQQSQMEDT